MRLTLLAHFLLDARIDLASRFFVGVGRSLLILCAGGLYFGLSRGLSRLGCGLRGVILQLALLIDLLLSFVLLAFALGAALFIFHYVLAQLAVGAEQTAIGDYKLRSFLFFCHKLHSLADSFTR